MVKFSAACCIIWSILLDVLAMLIKKWSCTEVPQKLCDEKCRMKFKIFHVRKQSLSFNKLLQHFGSQCDASRIAQMHNLHCLTISCTLDWIDCRNQNFCDLFLDSICTMMCVICNLNLQCWLLFCSSINVQPTIQFLICKWKDCCWWMHSNLHLELRIWHWPLFQWSHQDLCQ